MGEEFSTVRIAFYAPSDYTEPSIRLSGPSLGLAYISAYLKQQFDDIDEIFLEVDGDRVIARQPDLVGISVFSYAYGQAMAGARHIRENLPDIPIIIGGPHISALPSALQPNMDIGVIGEGEIAMARIISLIRKGQLNPQYLQSIPNLVYWDQRGKLAYSKKQEGLGALDDLPLPDRKLLEAYWPDGCQTLSWEPTLCTSRGCPFTCGFCMYSKSANLVRYHSIDRVMEDILDILHHYPHQLHIRINDDLFVTKKSRLKELADNIRAEKIHQRVTFGCMAKASFFDQEYCQILKSMNVTAISFGFESGSEPILHYLKDRHSTVAKNQQALDICTQYGLQVGGYFIIGAPDETPRDLAKTYWFIAQNLPKMPTVGVFPLLATPGTAVWHEAHRKGLIDENFSDWESFSYRALEHNQYLHLNQHYSLAEIKQYASQYFYPLKYRTSGHMVLLPLYMYLLKRYYHDLILPDIHRHFPLGSRLLEVGRSDRPLQILLEEDYDLTSIHWQDFGSVELSKYDGILFSHSLEKLGFDKLFSDVRSFKGTIMLVVENTATWPHIFALLSNKWDSLNSLKQLARYYFFSLKTIKTELTRQGYGFQDIQRYRLPKPQSSFSQEVRRVLVRQKLPLSTDSSCYTLLHHLIQDYSNHAILTQFKENLHMNSFLKEADVYSYSLVVSGVGELGS